MKLRFFVIGAQKAGTTSLFKYMSRHPELFIPRTKEAPFFSDDRLYALGLEGYYATYFSRAADDLVCGTVSPQYLADPMAPSRLRQAFPDARLICVLREPIERALSHYRMAARRQMDHRTAEIALSDALTAETLDRARALRADPASERFCYVAWSEYGRLLGRYFRLFPRENILVVMLDDLREKPRETLAQIFAFIGVDRDYVPTCVGRHYHKGGVQRSRIHRRIARYGFAKRLWRKLPSEYREHLLYWFEQANVSHKESTPHISARLRDKLVEHFSEDALLLKGYIGSGVALSWELNDKGAAGPTRTTDALGDRSERPADL